jgi:hypothetical protein
MIAKSMRAGNQAKSARRDKLSKLLGIFFHKTLPGFINPSGSIAFFMRVSKSSSTSDL